MWSPRSPTPTRAPSTTRRAALDLDVLEKAVVAVAGARRVDIYGIAASGLVGADLHQKLHRIGKISFVWSDPHLALTSAAVLEAGDVAVGISHTGTTLDTVDAFGWRGTGRDDDRDHELRRVADRR